MVKTFLPLCAGLLAAALLLPAASAAVKFSTVAPAADLSAEVDAKIAVLEKALADADSYAMGKKKAIPQAAGVIAVLAQALAEHDEKSPVQTAAPDLRDAALALAKAASFDDAKKALDKIKVAKGGEATGGKKEHAWDKLIDMDSLMAEVNARNGAIRKAVRVKLPDDVEPPARDASVLAVLGVAIGADTHEVKDAADKPKWEKYSADFTAEMTKTAAALRAKKFEDAKSAFTNAGKSCAGCHTDIRDK